VTGESASRDALRSGQQLSHSTASHETTEYVMECWGPTTSNNKQHTYNQSQFTIYSSIVMTAMLVDANPGSRRAGPAGPRRS